MDLPGLMTILMPLLLFLIVYSMYADVINAGLLRIARGLKALSDGLRRIREGKG